MTNWQKSGENNKRELKWTINMENVSNLVTTEIYIKALI
jgi:hypothetical protein